MIAWGAFLSEIVQYFGVLNTGEVFICRTRSIGVTHRFHFTGNISRSLSNKLAYIEKSHQYDI
jgi:hypothetical protein